ncbi:sporulation histidine kinase inhibitor Sda [Priestia aryabhattai]|nr:sporulation histidine kinase inhibitor Sda [Priestia aryabhattai]
MKSLSNDELKKVYFKSIKLGLEPAFIKLLKLEIERRQIDITELQEKKKE